MDKYRVRGEVMIAIPFDLIVKAKNPVEAEMTAVNSAKTQLAAERGLVSERRPENVVVNWVQEEEDADL